MIELAVWCDEHSEKAATVLAQQLALPLIREDRRYCQFPYVLCFCDGRLSLQQTGKKAAGPVSVNFLEGAAHYRRLHGGGELLIKALGANKKSPPTVLDLTAGLGRDSFVLAAWGCRVTLLERSPIVAALLQDGLSRASEADDETLREIIARMQLKNTQAKSYLQGLLPEHYSDVIYIDPMFPESKKSALVKKDMQAFHKIVGIDKDSDELLELALTCARHRVVVKRPKKASFLASIQPTFSVEGKAVRFDIYALKAFSPPKPTGS